MTCIQISHESVLTLKHCSQGMRAHIKSYICVPSRGTCIRRKILTCPNHLSYLATQGRSLCHHHQWAWDLSKVQIPQLLNKKLCLGPRSLHCKICLLREAHSSKTTWDLRGTVTSDIRWFNVLTLGKRCDIFAYLMLLITEGKWPWGMWLPLTFLPALKIPWLSGILYVDFISFPWMPNGLSVLMEVFFPCP